MKVRPRLEKLEGLMPKECGTCRSWSGTVVVDDAGITLRPGRCLGCGRRVPVALTVHLVGVDLELV